tara:strand:- start:10102 stop:10857 length:756 start_codon:yes stop_codon:yes gene_type:complete
MTDMAKVSVTFSQKVSEAPYETADYSLTIERTLPESVGADGLNAEAAGLFDMVKSEVLKQAGQDYDLSDTGVVMRRLKSAVSEPSGSAPSAPAKAPASSEQNGPTAKSVAAPPAKPSGGVVTGRAYKRLPTCVGKNAEVNQAAFNILAFHPNKWAGDTGEVTVYQVKEHADGTTDVTKSGKNFPNFSVSKEALKYCEISVERDHGIWVRDGDSNVPLTVWDQVSGQTEEDAVEWDWLARRAELQQYTYKAQ